jgi:hypothetical protein
VVNKKDIVDLEMLSFDENFARAKPLLLEAENLGYKTDYDLVTGTITITIPPFKQVGGTQE